MDYALYIATVIGAAALFMMMPRRGVRTGRIGAILGGATLGGLWLYLSRSFEAGGGASSMAGLGDGATPYYYVFSALAIGSAVRVITHTKPVYAALWFVMVVLASSGLFLVLGAEFMAFAMVIIYGGAILVTYVFVIMLASHAGDPPPEGAASRAGAGPGESPDYDKLAREPAAAVAVGFVLLAVLLNVAFEPMRRNPAAEAPSDAAIVRDVLTERPAGIIAPGAASDAADAAPVLDNAERVGLDLFQSHPLGLELAGVILLVSLVGAVVIARQRADAADGDGGLRGAGGPSGTPLNGGT